MPSITVIGEALVDLFADPGRTLSDSPGFTPRYGGAPANLAVSAAKLGGDVGFIGRVGADGFGDGAIASMSGWGVNTDLVVRDPDRATMIACVALPTPETPEFLLLPGANENLVSADVPQSAMTETKILAYGSVTLAYASCAAALESAERAKKAGIEVVFDVNLRPNIWPNLKTARDTTRRAIETSSVVKLNMEECEFLYGHRDPQRASVELLEEGASMVCISDGARGSRFFSKKAHTKHEGFKVKTVDATGAGDAFLAAIVVLLSESETPPSDLNHAELAKLAAFANAAGALVATRLGAVDAKFSRADVNALVKVNAQ